MKRHHELYVILPTTPPEITALVTAAKDSWYTKLAVSGMEVPMRRLLPVLPGKATNWAPPMKGSTAASGCVEKASE